MKTSWTLGLGTEAEKDLKINFKESLVMRKRMISLLEDLVEKNRKEGRSKESYGNPSWPYKQADHVGYERALFEVLGLLED